MVTYPERGQILVPEFCGLPWKKNIFTSSKNPFNNKVPEELEAMVMENCNLNKQTCIVEVPSPIPLAFCIRGVTVPALGFSQKK